jgi:AraC family transcriptional activator of pobA
MKFRGNIKEYLYLISDDKESVEILNEKIENSLTILWFTDLNPAVIIIDGKEYVFTKNDIVFLTEFHKVITEKINGVRLLRFNRPFYCILDNDIEVGCKGILFFGASQLPIVKIPEEESDKFETLWKMFSIEMQSNDNLQMEMLQMMLKRYLILCTRIYKSKANYPEGSKETDIIREFNFLVEKHFKTKHSVAEYADLLNKSPKTISNTFLKLGSKTPLQFIQDRKMLEARRLLNYSSKQIKEIAYEIGFEDIQAFSRFFKNQEGIPPSKFKEKSQTG